MPAARAEMTIATKGYVDGGLATRAPAIINEVLWPLNAAVDWGGGFKGFHFYYSGPGTFSRTLVFSGLEYISSITGSHHLRTSPSYWYLFPGN
jgi:hypothetical protein